MSDLILDLTCISKRLEPCYGGTKVLVDYELKTHSQKVKTNMYKVTAEVKGLMNGDDIRLDVCRVRNMTNNEDTLMAGPVGDLLSDSLNWG